MKMNNYGRYKCSKVSTSTLVKQFVESGNSKDDGRKRFNWLPDETFEKLWNMYSKECNTIINS